MSFNTNGFLGVQINEVIANNYQNYKEWFLLCEELNRFSYSIIDKLIMGREEYRSIILATLYVSIQKAYQGSIIMYKYGLDTEAKVITRSALESLFYLKALFEDDTFRLELLKGYYYDKKKTIRKIKLHPDAFDSALPSEVDTIMEEIKNEESSRLFIEDVSKKAGLHHLYVNEYSILCNDVHPNLNRIIRGFIQKNNKIEGIDRIPSTNDIEPTFTLNCYVI